MLFAAAISGRAHHCLPRHVAPRDYPLMPAATILVFTSRRAADTGFLQIEIRTAPPFTAAQNYACAP